MPILKPFQAQGGPAKVKINLAITLFFFCFFFMSIVFSWVSLGMLMIFQISAIYYAYNMLKIMDSIIMVMT